jgi:hypothetical protein
MLHTEIIVTCRSVRVTKIMRSGSDDWLHWHFGLQVLLITLSYNAIAILHSLQTTVAQALKFCDFNSRLLATDFDTETSTSNLYKVFLIFRLQSFCTALS